MGLKKTEVIYNGEMVEYHRIASFEVDFSTGACTAFMHSWATKEDRDNNKPPQLSRRFNFEWIGESMADDAYIAIKSIPYWSDAEDV